jgi:uncharacterized membrane protein YkoI
MNPKIVAAIALTTLGALVYAGSEEHSQKVAMSELPAAVQKTIQDNLGGGAIAETSKETKGGKTWYEAQVKKSGGEEAEIKVAEDGNLLSVGKGDDDD